MIERVADFGHLRQRNKWRRAVDHQRVAIARRLTPWYVDQPIVIPMDFSLPDDKLWQWIEDKASNLPGFRPVEEWRAGIAERMRRR